MNWKIQLASATSKSSLTFLYQSSGRRRFPRVLKEAAIPPQENTFLLFSFFFTHIYKICIYIYVYICVNTYKYININKLYIYIYIFPPLFTFCFLLAILSSFSTLKLYNLMTKGNSVLHQNFLSLSLILPFF